MDYSKTRCPECFKFFCCSSHRDDHRLKHHSDVLIKSQDCLVTFFQKKAETILLKSQKYKASLKNVNKEKEKVIKNSNPLKRNLAIKRLHSEMEKRMLTKSVTVLSETRRILIPIHRIQSSSSEAQVKSGDLNGLRKDSPCDSEIAKTSTPIIGEPKIQTSPEGTWEDDSSASSLSNYQTPCIAFPDVKREDKSVVKRQPNKSLAIVTPLRSIMSKISKYEIDSEMGPNVNINSSRSRRVTFSFSSQYSSANSSPLESVQEIEVHEEIQHEKNYIAETNVIVGNSGKTKESVNNCEPVETVLEDSSPLYDNKGFFSCMTNMFCTAVHTIPSFASWRISHNLKSRPKRSRSPEGNELEVETTESPIHKRPCYPCDLRLNPIKARKPISNS